jgi:hypothetical protein
VSHAASDSCCIVQPDYDFCCRVMSLPPPSAVTAFCSVISISGIISISFHSPNLCHMGCIILLNSLLLLCPIVQGRRGPGLHHRRCRSMLQNFSKVSVCECKREREREYLSVSIYENLIQIAHFYCLSSPLLLTRTDTSCTSYVPFSPGVM